MYIFRKSNIYSTKLINKGSKGGQKLKLTFLESTHNYPGFVLCGKLAYL